MGAFVSVTASIEGAHQVGLVVQLAIDKVVNEQVLQVVRNIPKPRQEMNEVWQTYYDSSGYSFLSIASPSTMQTKCESEILLSLAWSWKLTR